MALSTTTAMQLKKSAMKIAMNGLFGSPYRRLLWIMQREYSEHRNYMKYYAILGIPSTSDQEGVRRAFLKLVKEYHPDSGSSKANKEKFLEIETAYRKLQEKFSYQRWNINEGVGEYGLYHQEKKDDQMEFDIKHTAPQHRQYLSYEGFGSGTPNQRYKQYQKKRAMTAIQNVYTHRISQVPPGDESALVIKDKKEASKIKIRSEMERLVEDLIQESMARGDFDNLSGSGKPLSQRTSNPYVDFVTQKMNEVLIDNGFTPEWITLQKEISNARTEIRNSLAEERTKYGPEPLVGDEIEQWSQTLRDLKDRVLKLNKKIDDFNLQVPLLEKQMIFFQLEVEASKIVKNGKTKFDVPRMESTPKKTPKANNDILITIIEKMFFRT